MKCALLSLVGAICSFSLLAQIEIDGNTYTNAGTVLYSEMASPDWETGMDLVGINGEDQVWDASDWEGMNLAEEVFVEVSEAPFTYQFFFNNELLYPDNYSNHTISMNLDDLDLPLPFEIGDPYSFFRNDEEGYFETGMAFSMEGLPIITQNDIPDRILTFPLVYGNVDTTSSEYLTSVPLIGAYGQKGTRISNVDGWGTLITPDGAYEVLRVSAVRNLMDTIFVEQFGIGQTIERPEQIDYLWISQEIEGPMLSISVVNGEIISAQMNREQGPMGLVENSELILSIYPNPSQDYLNVKAEGIEQLFIADLTGRAVLSEAIGSAQNTMQLDLRTLLPGVYLLKVKTNHGFAARRFIKE